MCLMNVSVQMGEAQSAMFTPILRGWHLYYGRFYESALSVVW